MTGSFLSPGVAAIILFLIGSALCGFSQNLWQLIGFRALQGLGGAGLLVGGQAIVADVVPPRDRGKFLGPIGSVRIKQVLADDAPRETPQPRPSSTFTRARSARRRAPCGGRYVIARRVPTCDSRLAESHDQISICSLWNARMASANASRSE